MAPRTPWETFDERLSHWSDLSRVLRADDQQVREHEERVDLPFAKDNAAAGLNNMVRIFVPEDLATCDRDVVLLTWE